MVLKKYSNIVYIRTIATIMVVAYHSICMYTDRWSYGINHIFFYETIAEILNKIDMPAFVFISGYLFADQISKNRFKTSTEIIIHKSKRLLIPYIFWMIIVILLLPEQLTFDKFINGFSHLWFLPMLFQLFLLAVFTQPLWTRINKSMNIFCVVGMFLFVFISYYKGWNIPFLYIKTFFPFFYMGIITHRHNLLNMEIKKKSILVFILCVTYIITCTLFHTDNPAIRDIIIKMIVCAIIFLTMILLKNPSNITNKYILLINDNSMGIYLIHHIIIQYSLTWDFAITYYNNHFIIGPITVFTLSLFASILLSSRISKIPHLHNII